MPYVNVDVEVELDVVDTEDLIREIESRGFEVYADEQTINLKLMDEMEEVVWRYRTGYIEDAMILLERSFPELYGISKLIRS